MNGTEAAELRALDRKLTDGLNLVHGELAVAREERREDRREFREEIGKLDSRIARLDSRSDDRSARPEAAIREESARLDSRFEEGFTRLEASIEELTAKVTTLLELWSGTRRLILGVLALGILLLGAAIRPLLDRAVSALLAG